MIKFPKKSVFQLVFLKEEKNCSLIRTNFSSVFGAKKYLPYTLIEAYYDRIRPRVLGVSGTFKETISTGVNDLRNHSTALRRLLICQEYEYHCQLALILAYASSSFVVSLVHLEITPTHFTLSCYKRAFWLPFFFLILESAGLKKLR